MSQANSVTIYGLVDPRSGELRYIGKAKDPYARLTQHLSEAHRSESDKSRWLLELGQPPLLVILGRCSEAEWPALETRWIALVGDMGASLTNMRPGGEGNSESSREGVAAFVNKLHHFEAQHGERLANALLELAEARLTSQPLSEKTSLYLRCLSGQFLGAPESSWVVPKWQSVVMFSPMGLLLSEHGTQVPTLPPFRLTARSGLSRSQETSWKF